MSSSQRDKILSANSETSSAILSVMFSNAVRDDTG